MIKSYSQRIPLLLALLVLLLSAGIPSQAVESSISLDELANMEEQGIEAHSPAAIHGNNAVPSEIILLDSLPAQDVLLIPNTTGDYIGVYDPEDGTLLGNFVSGSEYFSTPVNATQGPDGNIYVTDQILDAIKMFDRQGNYLGEYANSSDGLDNIRGIEFRADGHLFVCSYSDGIIEFSAPHTLVGVFIPSTQSMWDIKFLDDGSALVSSSGTNNVILYDAEGVPGPILYRTRFPEQINSDIADLTSYLNTSMTADSVRDFNVDGTINEVTILDASRGVFRLGNGNLLVTSGTGVYEVQPGTNVVIDTLNTGANYFIELCAYTPAGTDSAEIDLSMTAIIDTVYQGSSLNRELYISNLGDLPLYFGLHHDSSWISILPDTGEVAGSETDTITITFSAASLTPGTYPANITVVSNDNDEAITILPVTLLVLEPPSGCVYIPGDINGNGTTNGIDVGYGVNYFKGGPIPPIQCNMCPQPVPFYAGGDVNGNCVFNGIDVTFFVNYLKGIVPALLYCPTCPPASR